MTSLAFGEEHVEDLAGGMGAKELAECFLVPLDSVALHQFEEVLWLVESECGFGEVWVFGDEVFRSAMDVGEVASASAGDEDFAAGLRIVFKEKHAAIALAGDGGTHQSGGTCAEDDDVVFQLCRGH